MGAILVSNRLRILLFAKPLYFFQVLFRRRSYGDLFNSDEAGPRLLFCRSGEKRSPFSPTPSEKVLISVLEDGHQDNFQMIPAHIYWKKYVQGASRRPFEYLFGLGSRPNLLGKLWFLFRKRSDSVVRGFEPRGFSSADSENELVERSEPLRIAKVTRRKILMDVHTDMRVTLGPRFRPPLAVKEELVKDPQMVAEIEKIAKEEGVDKKKILMRAYQNLTEIVATYQFTTVEIFYASLKWMFSAVFMGVDSRDEEVEKLKELLKNKSVVYVPCHRSHNDYLVLPFLLFKHNIVTPYFVAGINLSFWPLGPLLRRGGAFFIRRSFRGDPLYKFCLNSYIYYLLKQHQPFTFFIEGTRSRSGKMLPPTYGILKTVMESGISDIVFQPVSISYDQVPEEATYSKELGGAEKEKESTSALLKSRKIIQQKFGKIYVRFSEPIVLDEEIAQAEEDSIDKTLLLQKTAFHLSKSISEATPITPKSILSSILLNHRMASLSLNEIVRLGEMFADFAYSAAKQPLTVPPGPEFRTALESSVRRLQKSGVVLVNDDVSPHQFYCDEKKRSLLNFYKNSGIHGFVTPAIFLLSVFRILHERTSVDNRDEFHQLLTKHALRLRNLLKFEFFFNPSDAFLKEIDTNASYFFAKKDWKSLNPTTLRELAQVRFPSWDDLGLFARSLGDILESYVEGLRALKGMGQFEENQKVVVGQMVARAQQERERGEIAFPESISIQNYSNLIKLLDNLGMITVEKGAGKTIVKCAEWSKDLDDLLKQLSLDYRLIEQNPNEVLRRD